MRLSFGARVDQSQRKLSLDSMVGVQGASTREFSPLISRSMQVMALLGLQYNRPFHRDSAFLLLLAFGPIVWLSMIGFFTFQPPPRHTIWSPAFLSIALWQPLCEELLFQRSRPLTCH